MNRYKIVFSYDGSEFHGFQRQNEVRSVQKDLETALSQIFNENILIKGCSRTDVGVHAFNQVSHFDSTKRVKYIKSKLNTLLNDIHIKSVRKVDNSFHSRFDVKYKIYEFKISFNHNDDERYYFISHNKVDINKIREAATLFIGEHNYKNFVSGTKKDYITNIFSIKIRNKRNKLIVVFKGTAFYRYMIRSIMASLLSYGREKISLKKIIMALDNPSETIEMPSMPGNGLYLKKIKY